MKECTTHHHACECREAAHAAEIAKKDAKIKRLEERLSASVHLGDLQFIAHPTRDRMEEQLKKIALTLATERDAFGARECELMGKLRIARDELKFLATATTDQEFKKRIQHALRRVDCQYFQEKEAGRGE